MRTHLDRLKSVEKLRILYEQKDLVEFDSDYQRAMQSEILMQAYISYELGLKEIYQYIYNRLKECRHNMPIIKSHKLFLQDRGGHFTPNGDLERLKDDFMGLEKIEKHFGDDLKKCIGSMQFSRNKYAHSGQLNNEISNIYAFNVYSSLLLLFLNSMYACKARDKNSKCFDAICNLYDNAKSYKKLISQLSESNEEISDYCKNQIKYINDVVRDINSTESEYLKKLYSLPFEILDENDINCFSDNSSKIVSWIERLQKEVCDSPKSIVNDLISKKEFSDFENFFE